MSHLPSRLVSGVDDVSDARMDRHGVSCVPGRVVPETVHGSVGACAVQRPRFPEGQGGEARRRVGEKDRLTGARWHARVTGHLLSRSTLLFDDFKKKC